MVLQTSILRLFDPSALLIVAALISLCVSNNVGPRFLPLPRVTDRIAESGQENQRDTTSRPPSPAGFDSFRVPMVAQTQKRADNEQQPQHLPIMLKAGYVLPDDSRTALEFTNPLTICTSTSVLQPAGRAPPRLIFPTPFPSSHF